MTTSPGTPWNAKNAEIPHLHQHHITQPFPPGVETLRLIRSLLILDMLLVDTSGIWWNSCPFDSTAQVGARNEGTSNVNDESIAPPNFEKAEGT
jgi:hypothetical protein